MFFTRNRRPWSNPTFHPTHYYLSMLGLMLIRVIVKGAPGVYAAQKTNHMWKFDASMINWLKSNCTSNYKVWYASKCVWYIKARAVSAPSGDTFGRKIIVFRLNFHGSSFLKVQIQQIRIDSEKATSHDMNQWWSSSRTRLSITCPQWLNII